MNKVTDYPLMTQFLYGAFQTNSGGRVTDDMTIEGTQEEWTKAEAWWAEFWVWEDLPGVANKLGMQADSGYTVFEQDLETSENKMALPWVLLERYY